MDVSRDEYVSDMKALVDLLQKQQAVIEHLMNALSVKEEVAAEKERSAAHDKLREAFYGLAALRERVGVTEALGDFEESAWDILLDKLGSMGDEEEEE